MIRKILLGLVIGFSLLLGASRAEAQALQAKTFSALSTASTNCTLVYAAGPSLLQWLVPINTTSTEYFLKIYNTQTTPVAGVGTPVMRFPLAPQNTGSGGALPMGLDDTQFPLGIGYCITGGIADNDSSNAATGIAINIGYVPQ